MSFVHVNGELLPEQNARISVHDRGFLLGDGLFETMRAAGGRVLHLDQHLARLSRGAAVLGFELPPQAGLADAVHSTLAANDLASREAVVRLTVSRGVGPRGLGPPLRPSPTVVIIAAPLTAPLPVQQTAITLPFRLDAASPLVGLKTLNYLPQILGRQAALAAGADEGIFLNHADALVEGCASNLFWVRGNLLCTPDLTCGPLPGITRAIALTLASTLGLSVREGAFARSALAEADEAFLTNSVLGFMPLTRLDDRAIGQGKPGSVTARLQAALQQMAAA
ncbi:aminotransferase class IV [Candidatus Amarolinea aalborgensis]|uniref:aminotransferase class IV n=1 Tax=Candidatus Amarolinea aalborgensis TaxID=2249329 RepID=UPI003BFA0503